MNMQIINSITFEVMEFLVLLIGMPMVIHFSKNKKMNRKQYSCASLLGLALFVLGNNLSENINSPFFALMFIGVWLFFYATACRLNDLPRNKWLALCVVIPLVGVILILYLLMFKQSIAADSSEVHQKENIR